MFFGKSPYKKKLEDCKELIRLGEKVYNYRHDILPQPDVEALKLALSTLSSDVKAKAEIGVLDKSLNKLEAVMRKCGGDIYPVRFIPDNCEVFLVAAILAIGIRTFFFQPYMIPTNSMYPTYSGMTSAVYTEAKEEPGALKKLWRLVTLNTRHFELKAPTSGEVSLPISEVYGRVKFEQITGRKWFILPTPKRKYTLYVDNEPVSIVLPMDYSIEEVILKTFYPEQKDFKDVLISSIATGGLRKNHTGIVINTGKQVKRGDTLLNFDILSGDMLFVDRISYHFKRPDIGDPFVFRTKNLKNYPEDKYFIKRLVGKGGDTLEVKGPVLYRNGAPIEGAEAFALNANRVGEYEGYTNMHRLDEGLQETIPANHFYAMGDNSDQSGDSRSWGFVPEREVIGKACFIFYPFTSRWGVSK